jgi:hypothetical protein
MCSLNRGWIWQPFHDLQRIEVGSAFPNHSEALMVAAQLLKTLFFVRRVLENSLPRNWRWPWKTTRQLRVRVWVVVSQDSALLIGSCGNNVVLLCVPETSRNAKSIKATSGWYTKKAVQRRHWISWQYSQYSLVSQHGNGKSFIYRWCSQSDLHF